MKKIKLLVINAVLAVTIVFSMIGCGKETVATNTMKSENKKVAEVKKENEKVTENKKVIENKDAASDINKTSASSEPEPSKQNTSIPSNKNGKVIVIDPGHASRSNLVKEPQAPGSSIMKIKDGGGAQGVATRTPEHVINMKVALKLKEYLEHKGYTVVMTKTDNSLSLGNVERAKIWNEANAALAIRIHADSSDNGSVKGASMLVPSNQIEHTKPIYSESKRCGKIVLDSLINEVGMNNRGVIARDDMTGFNWSDVPVILVEMGFLSNSEEDKLLSSSDYEDKIAKALADGIAEAVK